MLASICVHTCLGGLGVLDLCAVKGLRTVSSVLKVIGFDSLLEGQPALILSYIPFRKLLRNTP
jgi:hypothetical protein